MQRLDRAFFSRASSTVAPDLLGKILVVGACSARISEVEAYGGLDDPASHAFRGPTPRTQIMFGSAGFLYVYLSYGLHHCANIVTGAHGEAQAVLLRAVVPLVGIDEMQARRPKARRTVDLADGPGKLCAALGLDLRANGADLTVGVIGVFDDGTRHDTIKVTPRIGITKAVDTPWRWVTPAS